jgi:hypothetical protein
MTTTTKANIWLCILFAALCGIAFTLSSVLPAYYAHKDKKIEKEITDEEENSWEDDGYYSSQQGAREEEKEESLETFEPAHDSEQASKSNQDLIDLGKPIKTSACMWKLVSFMSIALQGLGVAFVYLSTYYGPISVYAIVYTASYLLSGMLVMSYILGIEEKPDKDTRVGNYLIVIAAVLVVANGPIISNQEFTPVELKEMIFETKSIIFLSTCCILLLMTFPHHLIVMFSKKGADTFSDNVNFMMFQISIALLGIFNSISMKIIPNSSGWFFGLNLAIFIFISVYYPVVSLVQNVVIKNPGIFLSISSAATYLVNVLSGLLVWKDDIRNWVGYNCSIAIFLFGVYLITDTDIIKGISSRLQKMNSSGDHRSSLVRSLVSENANENGKNSIFKEIEMGRMSLIPTLNTQYRESFRFQPNSKLDLHTITEPQTIHSTEKEKQSSQSEHKIAKVSFEMVEEQKEAKTVRFDDSCCKAQEARLVKMEMEQKALSAEIASLKKEFHSRIDIDGAGYKRSQSRENKRRLENYLKRQMSQSSDEYNTTVEDRSSDFSSPNSMIKERKTRVFTAEHFTHVFESDESSTDEHEQFSEDFLGFTEEK